MLSLITKISFKPSSVKWPLCLTISATFLKSMKSNSFAPLIWYLSKNGIIISNISEVFTIWIATELSV
jgi:hypothetical protein